MLKSPFAANMIYLQKFLEGLISLNTRLHLPHAADGILRSMGIISYHIELNYVSWSNKVFTRNGRMGKVIKIVEFQ